MNDKNLERLELNKILSFAAEYATLERAKEFILSKKPSIDLKEVNSRLKLVEECDKLLYTYGVAKVFYFKNLTDILTRAKKGSSLSCGELLDVNALLISARTAYESISAVDDESVSDIKLIANSLIYDNRLESDITEKIISVDTLSDNASPKLYDIRQKMKNMNDRIRSRLQEYSSGKDSEFLRESIVTLRNDRYVIPVKAEHKGKVKGFVHDRSKTGATYFIEPEYILELNNELISLAMDEKQEIEAILKALSVRVGSYADELKVDMDCLYEIDSLYALAEYAYVNKCVKPKVNANGYINIIKGRHPLIDKKKVVPVSLSLGENYNFLLLSGANTGGKTVSLKMCGLFCLMAACGMFVPAAEGTSVSVFENIFCDVGDSQSIEESLSTFSSHIKNVSEICDNADSKSLVLIDELGGGTNPDEGQALAKAIVKFLLERGAKGIITTHFTPLKEFAYSLTGIENASMEFDSDTLKPLYNIKIGLPGASNALVISRKFGVNQTILDYALGFMSDGERNFENVVRRAEESRVEAEKRLTDAKILENEWRDKLNILNRQINELNQQKERINKNARIESRKIISERTERAEEILEQIEEIFKKEEITQTDLINARTLNNKLKDIPFDEEGGVEKVTEYRQADKTNLAVGMEVFVKPLESKGKVLSISEKKQEAEIECGSLKMHLKFKDLLIVGKPNSQKPNVKFVKKVFSNKPVLEINVIGETVMEALIDVDNFIDKAVIDNLDEIKIIHGVGSGKLKNAISDHLKRHKNVESFRLGKYGEGETGVTFIKLR